MQDFPIIDEQFLLSTEQIAFFQENKYLKIKDVFKGDELTYFAHIIKEKVLELNTETKPLEERDTYSKAFLQIMNLWTKSEEVRKFSFGKRLAHIATQLMEVEGVRMYHDQALFKEPGC